MQVRQNSGKRIQNYVFNFSDCIGQGNFSKVYKGYHEITKQVVAIKIIELSSLRFQKLQELLFSEIDVLKKLNHPNVLKCHEVFTSNRHCYIITQLCNEGDLQTKLRKQHTFTQVEAEPLIKDIFLGLLYLSSIKIVHRDLKVANIFLHNGRAKIADFGFAKFTTEKWKDVNIGSPIYMSPQGLIDNIYGPKTDVWAFGVLIYEFFHGQTPFSRCKSEIELRNNIIIPINWGRMRSDLSAEIKQTILRCMEVNQQKRCTFEQLRYIHYLRRIMEGNNSKWGSDIKSQRSDEQRKTQFIKPSSVQVVETHLQGRNRNYNQIQQNRSDSYMSPISIRQSKPLSPMHNQSSSLQRFSANSKLVSNGISQRNLVRDNKTHIQPYRVEQRQMVQTMPVPLARKPSTSLLISATITFKECVNLLHYCRLLYKFITAGYEDDIINKVLRGFLITCLMEISQHIDSKLIFYEGENGELREKKLQEVTQEYKKKYIKELGSSYPLYQSTLSSIRQTTHNSFLEIDSKINASSSTNIIVLGHCIIVIWHSTRLIQQCFQDRNYQNFGNYKQIEVLLNKVKNGLNYQSYQSYKQRLYS